MGASPELDQWIRGFERMPETVERAALDEWDLAARQMFNMSQGIVHVITGNLKASGTVSTYMNGPQRVEARLSYLADYAIYEHARGGSHAFITRAWQGSHQRFVNAINQVFVSVEDSWN